MRNSCKAFIAYKTQSFQLLMVVSFDTWKQIIYVLCIKSSVGVCVWIRGIWNLSLDSCQFWHLSLWVNHFCHLSTIPLAIYRQSLCSLWTPLFCQWVDYCFSHLSTITLGNYHFWYLSIITLVIISLWPTIDYYFGHLSL